MIRAAYLAVAAAALAFPAEAQVQREDDPYRAYTSASVTLPVGAADSFRRRQLT
jgi:hypothetical protein